MIYSGFSFSYSMERFGRWEKSIGEIDHLIPILTSSGLENVKAELKEKLD